MMTDAEQRAWVDALGSTPVRRIAVIELLLRYANADDMTPDDRTICLTQLFRLQADQTAWRRTHRSRS